MHQNIYDIELTHTDNEFFHRFYEDNIGLIYYFARRYTLSKSDFDDLVQEVVLRLLKHISSLREINGNPGKVAYYIRSTTQSAFIDNYREERKHRAIPYPNEILDAIVEERLLSQRIPFDSAYWDVQLLKEKLPARDWMLLEGKHIIGYSDAELGEMYGCSKNSVRMALSRARKKARHILFEDIQERGDSDGQ